MRTHKRFLTILLALLLLFSGCGDAASSAESTSTSETEASVSSSAAAASEGAASSASSQVEENSLPPQTGATEAETLATFQELVDTVTDRPYASLFFYDLMPGVRPADNGLDLYKTGCGILGEEALKDTYQTGTINIGFGDEELFYTPAPVMEAALQQYFSFSAEDLHRMMASYDPEIDGYWAPYGGGGGGFTPITTVLSVEIDGTTAILSCESIKLDEFGQTDPEVPPVYSSVRMVHSETYGWRFAAILVE